MPCYHFKINNQAARVEKDFSFTPVAKSVNYLQFTVTWENNYSWTVLSKYYAEFIYGKNRYRVDISDSKTNPEQTYSIPWEVIQTPGFSVCFYAENVRKEENSLIISKRITTNYISETILPTGQIEGEFANPLKGVTVIENLLISKEETDFIISNTKNILNGIEVGKLLAGGEVSVSYPDWRYSEHIPISGDTFIANEECWVDYSYYSNKDLIHHSYSKLEPNKAFHGQEGTAGVIQVTAPKNIYKKLIIQEGDSLQLDYHFDEPLTAAIQKVIDNSVGVLITGNY
jgi:hypothetical protein